MIQIREIIQSSNFEKQKKKLHKPQIKDLDKAVQSISNNPTIGDMKVGDLRGVQVYKNKYKKKQILVAYEIIDSNLFLYAFGSHENFYRDLKKYLQQSYLTNNMEKILDVRELRTNFYTEEGVVKAVDGLSYHINKGECVGLVGESGCGKSVSAMSILRLIPYPPGVIEGGEIFFKGEDLLEVSEERIQEVRGDRISMVFQEPSTSLNPVLSIERQLSESLELHRGMKRKEANAESVRLLELVGIPDAKRRVKDYPHQFSGGMQQRIMIAIALSCSPDLIIADEPTTALDVTVQAQILELIAEMRERLGTAVLIITHNLGVVARYVERLNVMYAGSLVETGPTDEIYAHPKHPYTIGLLRSVPRLDKPRSTEMEVIEGMPPNLADLPVGCPFAERCSFVMDQCREEKPMLEEVSEGHFRACFYDADKLS